MSVPTPEGLTAAAISEDSATIAVGEETGRIAVWQFADLLRRGSARSAVSGSGSEQSEHDVKAVAGMSRQRRGIRRVLTARASSAVPAGSLGDAQADAAAIQDAAGTVASEPE